jgi:hypothetical protein
MEDVEGCVRLSTPLAHRFFQGAPASRSVGATAGVRESREKSTFVKKSHFVSNFPAKRGKFLLRSIGNSSRADAVPAE